MTAPLQHIGVAPATAWWVVWTSETESGTVGPFDGPDEAAREAQTLLRAHHLAVVTIAPHIDDRPI